MNSLGYVIVVIVLLAAGGVGGWKACSDHRDALDLAQVVAKQDALTAAAAEIAKIDVRNVTIKRTVETQIREIPVYRDCKNTADVMKTVNDALKGGVQ